MRRGMLLFLSALPLAVAGACGQQTTPTTSTAPEGGLGKRCDKPAPGCYCVPAWWTNETCYSGPAGTMNVGQCLAGRMTCSDDGVLSECVGQVLPQVETCNGLDDDCNGAVDDLPDLDAGPLVVEAGPEVARLLADTPAQCMTGLPGLCAYGQRTCGSEAGVVCAPIVAPPGAPEVCNGFDDDCDGVIDNDLNNLGRCLLTDPTLKGECAKGYSVCTKGALTCESRFTAVTEICNGLDDNCDGLVDNDPSLTVPICPVGYYCAGAAGCLYCPYVFAWDGHRYRYETTVGGASLIGRREHLVEGRAAELTPMKVRLSAAAIDFSRGLGRARAKILVGDDEIAYVDRARLSAVYHPPGHEVLTSSSMQWSTARRRDPGELYALRTAAMRAPLRATWKGVRDVTASLSGSADRAAFHDVKTDNWYELDFGPIGDPSHARLIIDGWKLKLNRHLPDSVPEERPRLEVRSRDGVWHKALDLGAPRGDRKAIVIDLAGLDLPEGRWHFRLWTGTHEDKKAMWYIARVRLIEEAPASARVVDLDATRAELAFSGAPTLEDPSNHDHPRWAVDDGAGLVSPDQQTWGRFTRYGDVTELLASADDRLVVMRRGDAVELAFDTIEPPRAGEEISLLLDVDLLYKPRTWIENGRMAPVMQTAEPLPYRAMGWYPPPRPLPDDDARAAYLREWQTRVYERGALRSTG